MWKNIQYATHRMSYPGGALKLKLEQLNLPEAAAPAMAIPTEEEAQQKYEDAFKRFCAIFPDAFLVSERASYITGTSIAVDGGWIKALM